MKYRYSICYPDKEEIEIKNNVLTSEEVLDIVKTFDWDEELHKEIVYYSPSLEFVKLEDKKRLIISGIGNKNLETFQIMFIIPNAEVNEDLFSKINYIRSDSFTKEVTIEKGLQLLQKFIDGNYSEIKNSLDKDNMVEELAHFQKTTARYTSQPENKTYAFPKDAREFKERSIYEQVILRLLGPLVSFLFFGLAVGMYNLSQEIDIGVILFGGLSILFLIGTIQFEISLKK